MIQERTNHKKVNVNAVIGIFGRVTLHVFHENSDSKTHIKILQTHLIPNANRISHEFGYECRFFFKKKTLMIRPKFDQANFFLKFWTSQKNFF